MNDKASKKNMGNNEEYVYGVTEEECDVTEEEREYSYSVAEEVEDDYSVTTDPNNNSIIEPTEAGLVPSIDTLPYKITTGMVERYFQKKLNVVIRGMRNSGDRGMDDVRVQVVSLDMGKEFVPLAVILPKSVLKSNKKQNDAECVISYFQNDDDNRRGVKVKEPIMSLFSRHMYNVDDEKAFNSPDWRRARGVSAQDAEKLKKNRIPVIQRMNNNSDEIVTFIIDPIRTFYHMLRMRNNKANYRVGITGWKRHKSGEYRYDVERVIIDNNRKTKGGHSVADELKRRMGS